MMAAGYSVDLTVVWLLILAFSVFAYIVMDGFDLGVGMLFPFAKTEADRDVMMSSVAPVWDGNETWLVLGGGGLFAAFPLAYSVLMPALYAPIMAMLLGLTFRGVAFEYRWRTVRGRAAWDRAFAGGSFVAAFAQGVALGAILQGIQVSGRQYAGGWWDWLTPFTMLTGGSVVVGYGLLGATWLNMKTEESLQAWALAWSKGMGVAMIVCIVAVSAATPFLKAAYYVRWLEWPRVLMTAQVPLLVALAAYLFFRTVRQRREVAPFLIALALFALSFAGLCISMFPYLVPNSITIWDAAAPRSSQMFMLVGAAVLIPVILAYTGHAYWVFRGKAKSGAAYH